MEIPAPIAPPARPDPLLRCLIRDLQITRSSQLPYTLEITSGPSPYILPFAITLTLQVKDVIMFSTSSPHREHGVGSLHWLSLEAEKVFFNIVDLPVEVPLLRIGGGSTHGLLKSQKFAVDVPVGRHDRCCKNQWDV